MARRPINVPKAERELRRATEQAIRFELSRRMTKKQQEPFLRRMEERITKAAEEAARGLFPHIASIMGRFQHPNEFYAANLYLKEAEYPYAFALSKMPNNRIPTELIWSKLNLAPLSPDYASRKKKDKHGKKPGMFVNTGSLKASIGRQSAAKFGPPKVEFFPIHEVGATQQLLGHVKITVFPRIGAVVLPFINSGDIYDVHRGGNLEYAAMLGPTNAKKLANRGGQYRPLVPPMIAWYKSVVIPNAIGRVLQRGVSRTSGSFV